MSGTADEITRKFLGELTKLLTEFVRTYEKAPRHVQDQAIKELRKSLGLPEDSE